MIKKLLYILGPVILVLASCTKGFDKINTNPNAIVNVKPQQLLAPALVNSLTYNLIRNRNFNNELMQVTVNMSDAEGMVFRYDFRSNWSDYLYNGLFGEIMNFKDVNKFAASASTPNKSYMGISLICQSWLFSILTDTYGDIPYSAAGKGKPEEGSIVEPVFDKQKNIYAGIFDSLEKANNLLSSNETIDAATDPIYKGDVAKWRKFGNSLYLRCLLRVSGKSEVAQTVTGKIKEIAENPAKYPIISNNDESAILKWVGPSPYISPYVNGVRAQDFRAVAICSFFIDHLISWKDPRINEVNYGINGINRWGIAKSAGFYSGVESGYEPGADVTRQSYFYAMDQSAGTKATTPPAITMQTEAMTGMILNYPEVQLILAEAAAKGWISGSAQQYYNEGAKSSITLWVPQWNADIQTYLTSIGMQWLDAATLDQKMEKIHLQKYYALFFTDMQQWFEYRRTGHPVLPKGKGLANNGVMPARMTYPVYVQSTNPTNYKLAVAEQGPDLISTQVWWQKP